MYNLWSDIYQCQGPKHNHKILFIVIVLMSCIMLMNFNLVGQVKKYAPQKFVARKGPPQCMSHVIIVCYKKMSQITRYSSHFQESSSPFTCLLVLVLVQCTSESSSNNSKNNMLQLSNLRFRLVFLPQLLKQIMNVKVTRASWSLHNFSMGPWAHYWAHSLRDQLGLTCVTCVSRACHLSTWIAP